MEIRNALTTHGPLRPGSSQKAIESFIVIAPQLPKQPPPLPITNADIWSKYEKGVAAIVREVQKKHNGDPKRTYLTGFSFGGNAALSFPSSKENALWAARWAVDPTKVPETDREGPVWLSRGPYSGSDGLKKALKVEEAPSGGSASGPVPVAAGKKDAQKYERVYSDPDYGEKHAAGSKIKHGLAADLAYEENRVYDWLLTKSL